MGNRVRKLRNLLSEPRALHSFICSFIHSLTTYIYQKPILYQILDTGDTVVNKMKMPALRKLIF